MSCLAPLALTACALASTSDGPQIAVQQAKLVAGAAQADDWFGGAVAVSGDTAVVGAYRDDPAGDRDGG